MIVIGSAALQIYGLNTRKVQDFDLIMSESEFNIFRKNSDSIRPNRWGHVIFRDGHTPIEIDISETGQNLCKIVDEHNLYKEVSGLKFAHPSVILTLKLSHKYLKDSPHFLKTMRDIQYLSGQFSVPECLNDWFKERERETYNYVHPNLNQKGKEFFDPETVTYYYNHDDIHLAIMVGSEPAYKAILKDGAEVACSKEKFFALDEYSRLLTVLEEAYTLALERHQIPNNFTVDPDKSFKIALRKVCTSITSGWFREWAWHHYDDVAAIYNSDYVSKFKKSLSEGRVRDFGKW